MIQVSIGGMPRDIRSADENWINQQVNRRRDAGESVCIRVTIKTPDIDLTFSAPGCSSRGGSSGRDLTRTENEVYELWQKRGLNTNSFNGGNIVAFLKQIERII